MGARLIQAVIGAEREREWEEEENGGGNAGRKGYKYERVDSDPSVAEEVEDESDPELELEIERDTVLRKHSNLEAHLRSFRKSNRGRVITMAVGVVGVLLFLYWAVM